MEPLLETGILKEITDGHVLKHKYRMTFLDEKHLSQIMALQEVIVDGLSRPDMLESFSHNFMKAHLGPQGFIIGVFCSDRLIAFRNVYFPQPHDTNWNLGIDAGLAESERAKVANLQMVCVDPGFRGNGLAFKMNRVALRLLRQRSIYEHICATVSPYNFWNIRILLKSGFCITTLKTKYTWKLRYIVYRNLFTTIDFINGSAVHIPLNDLEIQKQLFDSGYLGVGLMQVKRFDGTSRKDLASCFNLTFMKPSMGKSDHFMSRPDHGWSPKIGDCMNSVYMPTSTSIGVQKTVITEGSA